MAKKKVWIPITAAVIVAVVIAAALLIPKLTDRTPGVVTDLMNAEIASTDTIIVSWTASEKATGYEVVITATSPGAIAAAGKELPGAPFATADTSITIPGLVCDEEYTVSVQAYNDADGKEKIYAEGEAASVKVKTFAPTVGAVTLTAEATSDTEIKLTWTAPEIEGADIDVTKYEIVAADAEDGEYATLANITDSAIAEYTQSGLVGQQTKWYKARALTELDGKTFESDWSVAVSATTQETPKPEPAPAAATPAPAEPTPAPAAPTAGDTNTIGGGSGPTVFECKCGAQFATEEEVQAHAHHYVDLWLHGKVTKEETEKHSNYRFW